MVLISLKVIRENAPDEPVKSSLKERRRKCALLCDLCHVIYFYSLLSRYRYYFKICEEVSAIIFAKALK